MRASKPKRLAIEYAVDVYTSLPGTPDTLVCSTYFENAAQGARSFAAYAEHYDIYDGELQDGTRVRFIEVLAEHVTLAYNAPDYLACVVNATTALLGHLHGRSLHATDTEWTAQHPYATDMGIPAPHTPTVMQELLEPYDFAVSRIAIMAGSRYADETDLDAWKVALGINPMGFADRVTSNAMYAQHTGMPLDVVNALFRVEYRTTPLPAAVVGECGWSGTGTGAKGGHAVYRPPRAIDTPSWEFAVQVAPRESVTYHGPVPSAAHLPRRHGDPYVDFESVRSPDNIPLHAAPLSARTQSETSALTANAPSSGIPDYEPQPANGRWAGDEYGWEM